MTDEHGKIKCPDCGNVHFEGLFTVHDQVTYQCWIYEDGTYDMVQSIKDYNGESELNNTTFKCMECGYMIDVNDLDPAPEEGRCEDVWDK